MDLWLQWEVAPDAHRWCLLVLVLAVRCADSPSSHSLRNFHMAVSEPGPGLPQFIAVAYVDDQPIVHYDSDTWRMVSMAPWMRKVEQDEPQYWDDGRQVLRVTEKQLREILVMLMDHFHHNSSTGPHTLQLMFSCELYPDGQPKGGVWKYAYDGDDLLALSMETPSWTVFGPQAEILKQKLGEPHPQKDYLDNTCVTWLRKYLGYGNETLQRTESPTVKVVRKKGNDSLETLTCQVYGFHPKEINVTWLKDGKEQKLDNLTGCVLPNSDGTYYTSLSIKVEPKERDRYRCRVEHSSLPGPLDRGWEEPASNLGFTLGISAIILAVVIPVVAGVTFYICKRRPRGSNKSAPIGSLERFKQLAQAVAGNPRGGTGPSQLRLSGVSIGGGSECQRLQMPTAPDRDSGQVSEPPPRKSPSEPDSLPLLSSGVDKQVFYRSRDGDSGQWSPCSTTWNSTSAGGPLSQRSTIRLSSPEQGLPQVPTCQWGKSKTAFSLLAPTLCKCQPEEARKSPALLAFYKLCQSEPLKKVFLCR